MTKHATAALLLLLAVALPTSAAAERWVLAPSLTYPRWAAGGATDERGRLSVFGGYVADERSDREYGIGLYSIDVFDPDAPSWGLGPPVPKYRLRYRNLVVKRKWERVGDDPMGRYVDERTFEDREGEGRLPHEVATGSTGSRGRAFWFSMSGVGAVYYDLATREWSQEPSPAVSVDFWRPATPEKPYTSIGSRWEGSFPGFQRGTATVATSPDQKIYVTGAVGEPFLGRGSKADPQLLSGVDVYDPVANTWKTVAPMRQPRQLHAAAFGRDGRLYVFGGFAGKGWSGSSPGDPMGDRAYEIERAAKRRALASVECYDPATDTWTDRAPMPRPRESMGAALGADGKIYVVGGTTSYEHPVPVDDVDVYDFATDTWAKGPSLRYPRRDHVVLATPDGKIYAVGGWAILGGVRGLVASDPTKDGEQDLRATVEVLETKPAN